MGNTLYTLEWTEVQFKLTENWDCINEHHLCVRPQLLNNNRESLSNQTLDLH